MGVVLALVAVLFAPAPATAAPHSTTRVSVARDGTQTNASSIGGPVSADGRYIAFTSSANNLVAGDTNNFADVFVRDNQTGTNSRVSVTSTGAQLADDSSINDISGNGRHVVFHTDAAVVPEDTNDNRDIYVHDRKTGVTTLISVGQTGQASSAMGSAAISADGRYVAFDSFGADLVAGDTNNVVDVFVRDRPAGTTTRVSISSLAPGEQAQAQSRQAEISADGRYVAFTSGAPNLVAGDINGFEDVFVHDRQSATTTRIVGPNDGTQATTDPTVSADGNHVAYVATTRTFPLPPNPQIYVHNRQTGTNTLVSVGTDGAGANAEPERPNLSANGNHVAFTSAASNLAAGVNNTHRHAFIRDLQAATTTGVSVASDGTQGNNSVTSNLTPGVSADGRFVAYSSNATNLVPGDLNKSSDVFLYDKLGSVAPPPPPKPLTVSVGDVRLDEGDKGTRPAVFTVSLSKPAASTVTVAYATANGTAVKAQPDPDYKATSGTLSFAPGTTSLQVKVPVLGDTVDDPSEGFSVSLSNVAGAKLGDAYGIGTIIDDDPQAITGGGLAIGDVAVYEGDDGARNAVFTVSLAQPRQEGVTVSYATANGTATSPADYTATSGTLSFAPGVISAKVKVPITPDAVREAPTETFTVKLSAATGAPITRSTGTGTVIDDD